MIALDEGALECDLAETYHIYDYRAFTPERVALFSVGLRDDARIKLKLSGCDYPLDTLLLASAVDRLSMILWSHSKDAERGNNKPESIVEKLIAKPKERDYLVFNSPAEFEAAMARINKKGGN